MRVLSTLCFLAALALSSAVRADLSVGDAAPAITVGQWVQGEPVNAVEKGKVHVVEFWATWCGPCKETIPHLTELSKKFSDVTFIGVSVWERDDSLVVPFVKEMGDKMAYRVAADDKTKIEEGAMATNWMKAANQDSIPTAFIINKDQQIAWIGHPGEMEEPLSEVVKGTFDVKAEAERFKQRIAEEAALASVQETVQAQVIQPLQAGKYDDALKALDQIEKETPSVHKQLLNLRLTLQVKKGDLDGAYLTLDEAIGSRRVSAPALNALAWGIMTEEDFAKKRDLDRVVKWSEKAIEMSEGKVGGFFDTLARAQAMQGNFDKAIETQQKGIEAATDEDLKKEMQTTLESYKKKVVPEVKQSE